VGDIGRETERGTLIPEDEPGEIHEDMPVAVPEPEPEKVGVPA
jgi:hypothetical protein